MGETSATVITFFSSLITAAIGWIGDVVTFVTEQPLILVPMMVFFLAGGAIGLFLRIFRG